MDLSQFKNNVASITDLVEAAQTSSRPGDDDRFWRPTLDAAKNGFAVIRFLPSPVADQLPYVRYWNHGFQGPTGRWMIENCPTSIGGKCPVCEANSMLWAKNTDESKKIVRQRKRKLSYVANIIVLEDSKNPEAVGTVKLFRFGKKIFDKLMDRMQPEFADEQPLNPFDMWSGADFALKIREVDDYRNYDKSEFRAPSALFDGDEGRLSQVVDQLHSIEEWSDPSNYKSYDELQTQLNMTLGAAQPTTAQARDNIREQLAAPPVGQVAQPTAPPKASAPEIPAPVESDDDDMAYFQRLANQSE